MFLSKTLHSTSLLSNHEMINLETDFRPVEGRICTVGNLVLCSSRNNKNYLSLQNCWSWASIQSHHLWHCCFSHLCLFSKPLPDRNHRPDIPTQACFPSPFFPNNFQRNGYFLSEIVYKYYTLQIINI